MPKKRQLVLGRWQPNPEFPGALGPPQPMGRRAEVFDLFARVNTAPDGSTSRTSGTDRLYGPGIIVDVAQGGAEVSQALVTVVEIEIAWPILKKLAAMTGWQMVDSESGQVFG